MDNTALQFQIANKTRELQLAILKRLEELYGIKLIEEAEGCDYKQVPQRLADHVGFFFKQEDTKFEATLKVCASHLSALRDFLQGQVIDLSAGIISYRGIAEEEKDKN